MQEFESISASSYDPSALAAKLTAKAAEGWSVVAIVPTGGDVTAFMSRDKAGEGDATKSTEAKATEPASIEKAVDDKAGDDKSGDDKSDDGPAPMLPAKTGSEPKVEAVSEPSGWAIAPEPAEAMTRAPCNFAIWIADMPTPEPASVQPTLASQPTSTYQPVVTPIVEPTPAPAPAAVVPAAVAPTPDPAPAPAVPAGWYADPAGRFELRYWDGSTWTEHVSRAGQQFTDPPVA